MRRYLIPVLLSAIIAGCAVPRIGPHRIDVQQGNALDQENVARLKLGLNRAQVRFLLGTPLVVDPFRTDRWDYVYLFYKSGQLTEQRRVTLFFTGDTLARIEGDLPDAAPAVGEAGPAAQPPAALAEATPTPGAAKPVQDPVQTGALPAQSEEKPAPETPSLADPVPPSAAPEQKAEGTIARSVAGTQAVKAAPPQPVASGPAGKSKPAPENTVVPPLPSPPDAPPYVDPRVAAEPAPGMIMEKAVENIRPDVMPTFPEPTSGPPPDDAVLRAVDKWAKAWAARNEADYFAAYDAAFVPVGDASRAAWETRRRLLLGMSTDIDVRIDSPSVERNGDGHATVTFNQFYRSESYRDAVVKQLRLVERNGQWLIVEEKILSVLRGAQP